MESRWSQQSPDTELQAAFRRHLPRRLNTLLRRARVQCRGGWDCNVLRALHDEIALLAGACGRYGMLDMGERLLALESALARPLAAHGVPDAAASAAIDGLLDRVRAPSWRVQVAEAPVAMDPFSGHPLPAGPSARDPTPADSADPGAVVDPESPVPPGSPRGSRVCIVDDDGPLVSELLLRLEQHGCEVVLVDRVDDLFERLQHSAPDLAILVADAHTPLDRLGSMLRATRRDPAQRVRLLVLLREATVELRLRALRAGADRCMALPASPDEAIGAAVELASVDQERAYRILIVDDDAAQALFAQAILRHVGMETRILGESRAVLGELDGFRPDLLLLDLNMPDGDGFELAALIRKRTDYVGMPIVFLSGDHDEERQFAALDAGGDDFLVKPIRPAHLVAAVTSRVRRTRAAMAGLSRTRRGAAGGALPECAQLLEAVSAHLAAGGGRATHGGLLAIELHDEAALRDRLGLLAFDELYMQVGAFIASRARAGFLVACHGNAGYLVFAPTRGERQLVEQADELLRAARDYRFGAQALAVGLACAVCAFDASTAEPGQVLAALELALTDARADPDRVVLCSRLKPDPDALTQRISTALAADAFALAFQPLVPIRGAGEPQYQALLRLDAGGREYVAADLVPVAVRIGAIATIDAQVVRRCIGVLAERVRSARPVRMFASQSLEGWNDIERPAALRAVLTAAAVQPDLLVLEFRAEEARRNMRMLAGLAPELRRAGVGLALAGIDAGALAAGWLEQLPLDYVKLAPELDPKALSKVVDVAHRRGLRVVAPRVETAAQLEVLRAAHVDLLQGHYFRWPARDLAEAAPAVGA